MRRKYGMMILVMAMMVLSFFQTERASADMIWEPNGDSFYDAHRGECQHLGRSYIANGPNGNLIVYKSPENPSIVTKLPNGSTFGCYFSYQDKDGITWALYNDFTTNVSGWVPYDYLVVIYDYISFEEEFGEQIVSEEGQLGSEWSDQEIYKWSYPGSVECSKMILGSDYLPEYSAAYIDEDGRKWVYGGYYRGHKNYWICMDAPMDDYATLYPEGSAIEKKLEAEQIEKSVAGIFPKGEAVEEIAPGGEKMGLTMILLGVLIGAVVVVSVVLLKKLKRK